MGNGFVSLAMERLLEVSTTVSSTRGREASCYVPVVCIYKDCGCVREAAVLDSGMVMTRWHGWSSSWYQGDCWRPSGEGGSMARDGVLSQSSEGRGSKVLLKHCNS